MGLAKEAFECILSKDGGLATQERVRTQASRVLRGVLLVLSLLLLHKFLLILDLPAEGAIALGVRALNALGVSIVEQFLREDRNAGGVLEHSEYVSVRVLRGTRAEDASALHKQAEGVGGLFSEGFGLGDDCVHLLI